MKNISYTFFVLLISLAVLSCTSSFAQKPIRAGTTAANFLEIGYGGAGNSMGDAYVSVANDLSSVYWNPAGLGYMQHNEAMFVYQPWLVGINTSFVGAGINLPGIGSLAINMISVNYGEMDVTTLEMQEGTGETFTPTDMSFGISYAKKITDWFSAGLTAKYITSSIWHTSASAFAVDLGVIVNTGFFSPTGERAQGLNIGMSIANYGTRMQYDGIDLINPIDIKPDEAGNYRDVPGQFRLQEWELPLIFRIGVSLNVIYTSQHRVTLAADALHPNNNSESVNVGGQYTYIMPSFGEISLRGGYKALFMEDSQYGLSLGVGITTYMLNNAGVKIEYAFREVGILGNTHTYGISVLF